jgi:hypothetical protein
MEYKDYRLPENRQEGFDKFYQFHVMTNDCSPDIAVETWMADDLKFDYEKRCVMALFHGATYAGPCESMFADKFPIVTSEIIPEMIRFFQDNKKRLLFSPDCKYRKMVFEKFLESIGESIKPYGTLGKAIKAQFGKVHKEINYARLQKWCMANWYHWGRMGHWCFSEALHRFIKAPILPPSMEFGPDGKSHTSGWAFCIGRDDLVEKMDQKRALTSIEVDLLEHTALKYMQDFAAQIPKEYSERATFFTLETACCNYKRQHKGSRYGGCYIDEQYAETIQMMTDWPEYDWLWQKYLEGRRAVIPHELLYELNDHESDHAYCKDWVNCLKDYGRIPRVEAYFNKEKQIWTSIQNLPFYGDNSLLSMFD